MTEQTSLLFQEPKNNEFRREHEAHSELTYDARSFYLNGERIFLNSATIHYFRMPKEEWRDVLLKAKLAGMNCIDTYFAWNVHEPEEGQWSFEGDHDCGAFLDLCAELGMWVIARPGPFICAEWDFGGFPYWLGTKPGVKFRENNEIYLHYVQLYFDQLIPIIRKRQLSAGGTVILVQVENEYGYLMQDEAASAHMTTLRDGILERGIDVPLITCVGGAEGTIEGANFWSGADGHYANLRAKQPDTPKIVTEFWTGWFENWGGPSAIQKTAPLLDRRIMEVLRAGYTGISHYMFYGGTNFGGYGGRTLGSSDIFMITSYDYDAPLNEYGRVTPKYAVTKNLSYFIRAFGSLLMESEDIPTEEIQVRHPGGISVRGRQSGQEKIWFIDSNKDERETVHLTLEEGRTLPVSIHPGQIVPLLDRVQIAEQVYLTAGALIAGNEMVNGELTLFIAADRGQRSVIELELGSESTPALGAGGLVLKDSTMQVLVEQDTVRNAYRFDLFHFQEPGVMRVEANGTLIRFMLLDKETMNRTWRVESPDRQSLCYAIGFDDVHVTPSGQVKGMIADPERTIMLLGDWQEGEQTRTARAFFINKAGVQEDSILESDSEHFADVTPAAPSVPVLSGSPDYSRITLTAKQRTASGQPMDFSRYGQDFGYLLYECHFDSVADETTNLILPDIQDTARIIVNGAEQALVRQVGAAAVPIRVVQGRNTLQLLVQHMGRLNFSPYLGESKGVAGPLYLGGHVQDLRRDWLTDTGVLHLDEVNDAPGGTVLRRSFTLEGMDRAVLVGALSKGLRINGVEIQMPAYQDWFAFQTLDLSGYVKPGEVNTLEMPYSRSPLNRLELMTYTNDGELQDWRMAGTDALLPQQWEVYDAATRSNLDGKPSNSAITGNSISNFAASSDSYHQPVWYRWRFAKPVTGEQHKVNLMLRLTGMSKGTIHVNGHHLGRYWQIGPQEDYKIPMAWLKEENELLIFDEEGRTPERVRLMLDAMSKYPWVTVGEEK
ncbi:beta-galactosidase [Paenibacillus barcinonensis]|uniref:Beta-galactosidase n=1 Tax=Paenibacillus barcinonensis TaxID=198119 RepID=A0A2V4VSG1_PAEBA|nr:beta-galactosidase [Paenibacillus barcinonensis]PYE49690.1 glycosyl hydrolase family 35 [Paenibacillus barcinonensis]QKS56606.1 beta-galactosidase [Paenibacillus barcinonensis]